MKDLLRLFTSSPLTNRTGQTEAPSSRSDFFAIPAGCRSLRLACLCSLLIAGGAYSADAVVYTIQWGTGTAPFQYHPEVTDYQVEATGIQNHQGVHGFVVHHNGTDTYYDIPGENYYITFLHVNNLGQVGGTYNANYGGFGCTSFFWNQGQITTFAGVADPHVSDMNDSGEVVGSCFSNGSHVGFVFQNGSASHFTLYDYLQSIQYNGKTYMLNDISCMIEAVNDSGQLLGHFGPMYPEPAETSFWYIATPVPEPGSVSLFIPGLFGFLRMRSRRSR